MPFSSKHPGLRLLAVLTVACATSWARAQSGAASRPGLEGLNDDAVRIDMAGIGMKSVLERSFVVDDVPADLQQADRAVLALHELSDPHLSAVEREQRLRQIARQIQPALPQIGDAGMLMKSAAILVRQGVDPDVNLLEYFGEENSDAVKARLRPVVDTAAAMYDRAVVLLNDQQTDLQAQIKQPNAPVADLWQKVYDTYQTALYTRAMLSYAQIMAMDKADRSRQGAADAAINTLANWDNPESGVQPPVRMQIAKINLLKSKQNDLRRARQLLGAFSLPTDAPEAIKPDPDAFTIFNAKYFTAVSDLLARHAEDAAKAAAAADDFRKAKLPDVPEDSYAIDILQYRIDVLKGDNPAAVKTLQGLAQRAPSLRAVIASQLLDKLPPNPDVKTLSPLVLSALAERAWNESAKPAPDKALLAKGLDAANEYLSRAAASDPETTPSSTQYASLARGVILAAQGDHAGAAVAFCDHVEKYKDDPTAQPRGALDQAITELSLVYRANAGSEHQIDIAPLEDRLFPLAVDTFHRFDLAYDYARRLQQTEHAAQAVDAFNEVPADDPNAFNALYYKMIALNQRLDADPKDLVNAPLPADRPAVIQQIEQLADEVAAQAKTRAAGANDPAQKRQYQSMAARTELLAADVARQQANDPGRALQMLGDFEAAIAGLPDERLLLAQALNQRVQAYIAQGDTVKATSALLQYLNTAEGNEGLQTVYELLTRLNRQLDAAQAANDQARIKVLADNRAALTPFLVKWAQSNPNPDISKYTYRYRVFDAATQKMASMLEAEAHVREQKLRDALARYQDLQSPENTKLYQATLDPGAAGGDYDPQVALGIGQIAFAFGDWSLARQTLGQLLADSKLGDGTQTTLNAAGQAQQSDNDQFWEAQYEFLKSTTELAKDPASGIDLSATRLMLGRLFAAWQEKTGGSAHHAQFEQLAKELDVPAVPAPPAHP